MRSHIGQVLWPENSRPQVLQGPSTLRSMHGTCDGGTMNVVSKKTPYEDDEAH